MLFQSATAVALVASFAAAQTQYTTPNTTVNIGAVPLADKTAWCQAQINSCGTLCSGRTTNGGNDCIEETLSYVCTCSANNSAPALAYYLDTIPSFLCQQTFADCDNRNAGNRAGKDACAADRDANCAKLNANQTVADSPATTSSSVSTTATGGAASTAATNAAAPSTTSSQAGAVPTGAAMIGSGVVAAGMAAAFGLLL